MYTVGENRCFSTSGTCICKDQDFWILPSRFCSVWCREKERMALYPNWFDYFTDIMGHGFVFAHGVPHKSLWTGTFLRIWALVASCDEHWQLTRLAFRNQYHEAMFFASVPYQIRKFSGVILELIILWAHLIFGHRPLLHRDSLQRRLRQWISEVLVNFGDKPDVGKDQVEIENSPWVLR